MPVYTISEGRAGLDQIRAAWDEPATAVMVPGRTSVDSGWLRAAAAQLPPHLDKGHFCLLSSGSTGSPRLFVGSKSRAEALARVLHVAQQGAEVAETLIALPLSYSYALVNQFVWAHVHGRRIVQTAGLSRPESLRHELSKAQDAMLCLVGAQARLMLNAFSGTEFPGVIRLHFAGGRFPYELLPGLGGLFPNATIFNNYGCVEAMPRLTLRQASELTSASDIGTPLDGIDLSVGPDSSLLFRSPFATVAEIDASGAREFQPGEWRATGDLAEEAGDGTWRLTGRSADVFKRHGEKVAIPQIVSSVAANWDGQACGYRAADSAGEDGYVLVVAPHPDSAQLQRLLGMFRGLFPRTQWPLRIESVPDMPVLFNGKIDNAALRDRADATLRWRQRI